MINAVIFDADGVIIQKGELFSQRLEREFLLPPNFLNDFFTGPFQNCLVGRADLKTILEHHITSWGLKMGTDELLQYWFETENNLNNLLLSDIAKIKQSGIVCSLASNQEEYRANYLRTQLEFSNKFDYLFFSCEIGYKKPEKNFYQAIINALNMSPEEILFWDDDIVNVISAKKLGIHAEHYTTYTNFKKKNTAYLK